MNWSKIWDTGTGICCYGMLFFPFAFLGIKFMGLVMDDIVDWVVSVKEDTK